MRNKLLVILGALALSSCGPGVPAIHPVTTRYEVVMPEDAYFHGCDIVALPDPKTLTNPQIAQLINDLVEVNHVCHNNNKAIHDYLVAAQKELDKTNPKN